MMQTIASTNLGDIIQCKKIEFGWFSDMCFMFKSGNEIISNYIFFFIVAFFQFFIWGSGMFFVEKFHIVVGFISKAFFLWKNCSENVKLRLKLKFSNAIRAQIYCRVSICHRDIVVWVIVLLLYFIVKWVKCVFSVQCSSAKKNP